MNDDPTMAEVTPTAPAIDVPVRPDPSMLNREDIIAELQRRGKLPLPGAIPSLREEQRKLELKKLAGSLDRADVENELARRKAQAELQAQPTDLETQANAAGRERVAGAALGIASTDPESRAKALNDERNRSVETAFAQTVGTLPDQFEEPANIAPVPFDRFFEDKMAPQINAQQDPRFPLGSKEDNQLRAQNYNRLFSDPKIKSMYDKYVTDTSKQTVPIKRGDPKYYAKLEEAVREKSAQDAYNAAKIKAVPGVLEAQAKAEAEAPEKIATQEKKLRDEIQNNKVLENAKLQLAAVRQIRDLASKPNPTNQDDLGLIYAAVRALDPVSAVREGEIKLLQSGIPKYAQLAIWYNSIVGNPNGVLDTQTRKNILGMADTQEKTALTNAAPELKRYHQAATESGLSVGRIFSTTEQQIIHGPAKATPSPSSNEKIPRDEADAAPTVIAPSQAPANAKWIKRASDGKLFLNPKFKG